MKNPTSSKIPEFFKLIGPRSAPRNLLTMHGHSDKFPYFRPGSGCGNTSTRSTKGWVGEALGCICSSPEHCEPSAIAASRARRVRARPHPRRQRRLPPPAPPIWIAEHPGQKCSASQSRATAGRHPVPRLPRQCSVAAVVAAPPPRPPPLCGGSAKMPHRHTGRAARHAANTDAFSGAGIVTPVLWR